ncbi:hypothetical protein Nepgr_031541 [Nepenthes gracilis]|uniref:Uncharacterized protein n=1 Tax=Nepenthes gracilis TaxID=150966 RepID=A0AAD3Y583_NEPGR|nr:hypothetical protein Nepgr_031541 [Nepenthes gracilis]
MALQRSAMASVLESTNEEEHCYYGGRRKENRIPALVHSNRWKKVIEGKLLQLRIIVFACLPDGLPSDSATDTATIAAATIDAAAASHWHSSFSYDFSVYAS